MCGTTETRHVGWDLWLGQHRQDVRSETRFVTGKQGEDKTVSRGVQMGLSV